MSMTVAALAEDYADVSDPSGEPIAVWERVSTDMSRQDITAQTRDLRGFIGAGSYNVRRVFRFEASAYKGKHTGQQAEMMTDVEAGRYNTIIAAMTSRYERRGWQFAMITALQLHTLGARIVAIDDASYGDMSSVMGAFGTIMKAEGNHDYSKSISDNVSRKFRVMDAEGFHRGAYPAGYATQCATCGQFGCKEKSHAGTKRLAAHPVAAEYVIAAFVDSAKGKSTPKIARTFEAANERYGLRLPVTPDGVAKMLRSPEYTTGHHKPGSACQCKFPPLVSPAQQKDAVAALNGRSTGRSGTSHAIDREDFSGALRCGADLEDGTPCNHVMYRGYRGGKVRKDGTKPEGVRTYVCEGRKGGCGKTVIADRADDAVHAAMADDASPWWIWHTTDPNAARDRALEAVKSALAALPALGLDEAEEDERRSDLRSERRRLQAIPDQDPSGYATRKTDDSGRELTEGDRWQHMTPAEQRDHLTSGSVYAYVRAAPGRTGAVLVTVESEASQD